MVACNATNSSAIDREGNIWVWGSGRYGLLGSHIKDVNYQVPKPLYLTTSGADKEEQDARDAFTREDQTAKYKVRDIAMGQYHMIVVAVDSEMHSQFKKLDYAADIFATMKDYLIKRFFDEKRKFKENELLELNERIKIERSLKEQIFHADKGRWPLAKWSTFYDYLFNTLQMNFNESISLTLDKLKTDLVGSNEENMLNLKELRDQILGYRVNTNCVFGWGLKDERLCVEPPSNSDKARRYMRCKVLGDLTNKQITNVDCGNSFSIGLTQSGDVYAWGIGKSGSLGLGEIQTVSHKPKLLTFQYKSEDTLNATDPEKRRENEKNETIVAIAAGQTHCIALTKDAGVYSWGNGQGGRLGHGDTIGQNVPEKIRFFENQKITDISCGDQHSGCINEQGQVYVWGVGLNGRLGVSTDTDREVPVLISEFNSDPCSRIFFGMNTSFAISKSSELYVWGSGQYGKLGLPNTVTHQVLGPRKLFTLSSKRIAEFAAGSFHTLALTYDGLIYGFGNSKEGKLGIRMAESQAVRIDEDDADKALSNMVEIPTLLANAPKFYIQGELKQVFKSYQKFQSYTSEGVFKDLDLIKKFKIIQTACGDKNSYYLSNSGFVYATGSNDKWQCSEIDEAKDFMDLIEDDYLQNDRYTDQELAERGGEVIPRQAANLIREFQRMQTIKRPYEVKIFSASVKQQLLIKQISAGANHILCVSANGQVFGWGDNEFGQLGLGRLMQSDSDDYVNKPTQLKDLKDKRVIMTACGRSHSLFLTQLGQVYSAGHNEFGQLGVKTEPLQSKDDQMSTILENYYFIKTKPTPERVDLENIRFIAAGDSHSFAISDSSHGGQQLSNLYSWGWGAFGQLGHSKIKNYYNLDRPKKVKFRDAQDTKIAFVSAGRKHSVCLDMEGRIWYFGDKMSVGIREPMNKLQFEPIRLTPTSSSFFADYDHGFVLVDCNQDSNLAISAVDNSVYYFGSRNTFRSEDEILQDAYQSDEENLLNEESSGINLEAPMAQTEFKMINFKKTKNKTKDFSACYVSIGQEHFVATEQSETIPYTWGSNSSGQLGKSCNACDMQSEVNIKATRTNHTCDNPAPIQEFLEMVSQKQVTQQEFMRVIQDDSQLQVIDTTVNNQENELNQVNLKNWRFPIQVELKKQYMGIPSTYELLKSDIKLKQKISKLVSDLHSTCRGVDLCQNTMKARAQDGLITRILQFPTLVAEHSEMQSSIPKTISRNRQVFEAIFTYLQAHPCYVIDWIKNTKFFDDPEDLHLLLSAIYGKREMKNNPRIINTFVLIAKAMFDLEAEQNNFKALCSVLRTESPFRTIFKIIFVNQAQNLGFIRDMIAKLLCNLQDILKSRFDKDTIEQAQFTAEELNLIVKEIIMTTLDTIRKRIDLLGGIDLNKNSELKDQNHLSLQILSLLDYVFKKLMVLGQKEIILVSKQSNGADTQAQKEEAKEESKHDGEEQKLRGGDEAEKNSQSGRAKDITYQMQRDFIFPYLLDLLFESFVDTLDSLTYEQIAFEFWDLEHSSAKNQLPDKDIFNQHTGIVLLNLLGKTLKMYFRGHTIDIAPQFKELISNGSMSLASLKKDKDQKNWFNNLRTLAGINFREEIALSLFCQQNFKPSNLELLLVDQLFQTCIEADNPTLSASVSDIMYVYNALVYNEDLICQKDFAKDPLRHLIHSLGGKQIDPKLSSEDLRQRVNLQITCRFIYQHKQIAKCALCFSPVIDSMISEKRFQSIGGKAWQCKNRSCKRFNSYNPAGTYQCSGCDSTMPNDLLGKDLIFRQFKKQKTSSEDVKLFKFALKALPMIEQNQDMLSIIEAEVQNMDIVTKADQLKQENLLKLKESIQKSETFSINTYLSKLHMDEDHLDDEQNIQLQVFLKEKMFLDKLIDQVMEQVETKKNHQQLIKQYQATIVKIGLLKPSLTTSTIRLCQNLDQLLYNSYTGMGSKFLKDKVESQRGNFDKKQASQQTDGDDPQGKQKIVERLWAGNLHIELNMLRKKQPKKMSDKEKLFGESMQKQMKKKSNSDIINEYFSEITTGKALSITGNYGEGAAQGANRHGQGDYNEVIQEENKVERAAESLSKELIELASEGGGDISNERAITGRIKYVHMLRDQVIKSVDSSRYDYDILKHCNFTFNDNGSGGFFIELVYSEPAVISVTVSKADAIVLENFEISRQVLMEMRRNFAFHSMITFGMLQFRVHQLVQVLNDIISMNNIFQSLSLDEHGMRVKRESVLTIKVDRESNDGQMIVKQVKDDSPVLAKELKNNTQNSSNKKDPKASNAKNKKDQKSKRKK